MGTLLQDVRFALRHLRKTPGFSAAAIGTLALGIGATTAIFSTVNAALLRPLPYPNPGDLYGLRTTLTDGRVTTGLLSPAEIVRLNDPKLSIARAAGLQQQDVTLLRDDGTPVRTSVYIVNDAFFDVFGLPLSLGGLPTAPPAPNTPPAVVISTRIWRDHYNNDPNIVGKPIKFAEAATTIAGVAPKYFDTPHGGDFWFVVPFDPAGGNHSFDGYVRLKPGTTLERAKTEMGTVMNGLAKDYPLFDLNRAYVVKPLVEQLIGDLGPILIVVLSATALLLILACVNVTNLMLARGAARAREMAVRVALGAGRGRLVRQLLTESIVLATAGALGGLFLANIGLRVLLAAGAQSLPRLEAVTFDSSVLGFALLTLAISGLIVGFAPAIRLASTDLRTLMNESSRSATGGRATARWLGGLMIAEIALAVVLVAGAGWLIRSFDSLRTVNPGFVANGRLVFDVSFLGPEFTDAGKVDTAAQTLLTQIQSLPGVASVGTTSNLPLQARPENSLLMQFRGEPFDPANPPGARQRFVSPGFFNAMGIPVISGRDFNADDRPGGQRVVVVNRTFVKKYLSNRDPMGVRFSFGYPNINPNSESMIVGVVEDVRQRALNEPAQPAFYSSDRQNPIPRRTVVVETKLADLGPLQTSIRDEIRKLNPQLGVEFTLASDLVAASILRQQLGMQLMLVFGGAALLLAAVGIYGVIAFAASTRRDEVATRLALGATPGSIFRLVLRQGRTLAIVGALLGLLAAYLAGHVVATRLYGIQPTEPLILTIATIVVALLAVTATAIPAIRAARLDPSQVLRPQ